MIGVAEERLTIAAGDANLEGTLHVPGGSRGLVVFAHGAGSGRLSPRNRLVATQLEHAGLATCLIDMLTPAEIASEDARFDVPLMSRRLRATVAVLQLRPDTARLRLGLFGASCGAAAALYVASDPSTRAAAVVTRGGRVDLAVAWFRRYLRAGRRR